MTLGQPDPAPAIGLPPNYRSSTSAQPTFPGRNFCCTAHPSTSKHLDTKPHFHFPNLTHPPRVVLPRAPTESTQRRPPWDLCPRRFPPTTPRFPPTSPQINPIIPPINTHSKGIVKLQVVGLKERKRVFESDPEPICGGEPVTQRPVGQSDGPKQTPPRAAAALVQNK
jgi:hypothetical protein